MNYFIPKLAIVTSVVIVAGLAQTSQAKELETQKIVDYTGDTNNIEMAVRGVSAYNKGGEMAITYPQADESGVVVHAFSSKSNQWSSGTEIETQDLYDWDADYVSNLQIHAAGKRAWLVTWLTLNEPEALSDSDGGKAALQMAYVERNGELKALVSDEFAPEIDVDSEYVDILGGVKIAGVFTKQSDQLVYDRVSVRKLHEPAQQYTFADLDPDNAYPFQRSDGMYVFSGGDDVVVMGYSAGGSSEWTEYSFSGNSDGAVSVKGVVEDVRRSNIHVIYTQNGLLYDMTISKGLIVNHSKIFSDAFDGYVKKVVVEYDTYGKGRIVLVAKHHLSSSSNKELYLAVWRPDSGWTAEESSFYDARSLYDKIQIRTYENGKLEIVWRRSLAYFHRVYDPSTKTWADAERILPKAVAGSKIKTPLTKFEVKASNNLYIQEVKETGKQGDPYALKKWNLTVNEHGYTVGLADAPTVLLPQRFRTKDIQQSGKWTFVLLRNRTTSAQESLRAAVVKTSNVFE